MFTGEFLSAIRAKAVRQKVYYRALDGLERGILYLSSRLVDRVSNVTLSMQLAEIVTKLMEALKSGYQRHLESFGVSRVVEVVMQAVKLGYRGAVKWVGDGGFTEYLTVLDLNQPAGYR
jgi:hypothetical protein